MFTRRRKSYSFYKTKKFRSSKTKKFLKSLLYFFIIYKLVTALLVTSLQPENDGMNPTLTRNECLVVLPFYYSKKIFKYIKIPGIREPERGDIVYYTPSYVKKIPWYLNIPNSVYEIFTFQRKSITDHTLFQNPVRIKHIIALPGDTVSVKNNILYIKTKDDKNFKSEFKLSNCEYNITFSEKPENWETRKNPFSGIFNKKKLGKDEFFLIGDNRDITSDSRNTEAVKRNNIKGKIILRYWPLKKINVF